MEPFFGTCVFLLDKWGKIYWSFHLDLKLCRGYQHYCYIAKPKLLFAVLLDETIFGSYSFLLSDK
jgi:hypothetical protein